MSSSSLINKRANQPIHGPTNHCCLLLLRRDRYMQIAWKHANFYVTFGYSQYIHVFSSRHRYCLLSIYSFSNLLIVRSSLFLFCWSEEKTPNLSPRWLVADWMTVCPTDTKEKVSYENECSSFFFENNRNYVLKPLPRADPQCFSHFPYGNAWVCMRVCLCVKYPLNLTTELS